MGTYRISVFKTLLSSDGHPFKCLQFTKDIMSAKSEQRAIDAARCRYQRDRRIPEWNSIADIIEANVVEAPALERPHSRRPSNPAACVIPGRAQIVKALRP